MKPNSTLMTDAAIPRRLALAALCLAAAFSAPAATNTWTGASGSDLNWSTAGNWDPAIPTAGDDVSFFTNGVAFDVSVNNTVDVDTMVQSLSFTHTNAANGIQTFHNTYINDGRTLLVMNTLSSDALFVGSGLNLVNASTRATISGYNGTLVVEAASGNFNVRQGGIDNNLGLASLDMSTLSNASIKVKSLLVAGDGSNGGLLEKDRASGELKLAQNNTLTLMAATAANPPALTVGYINGNGATMPSSLVLGYTNFVYSDSGLGIGLNRSAAQLTFPSFGSYGFFRSVDGVGRQSKWEIGDSALLAYSGNPTTGTVDFDGSYVDALVDQLVVGRSVNDSRGLGSGGTTGTLTLGAGALDVNTVIIGYQMQGNCARVQGTLNVNSGGTLIVNNAMQLGRFMAADPTNGQSFAVLNINNGSVSVTGSIITATSPLNPDNRSELNLQSGSLYVKGTIGPLSMLQFGSATTLTLDLGSSPNPSAPLCIASNLNTVAPVSLNVLASALGNGTITIIKYGTWNGSFSDFEGVLPAKFMGYFSNNTANSSIDLVITNTVADTWNGRAGGVNNGSWDIGGTQNWKTGTLPAYYTDGDIVRFDDTAAGTTTVDLASTVSPATTYVANSTKSYLLGGGGALSGPGGITKSGSGTLTIANTSENTFTGPVQINGGTLQIGGQPDRLPAAAAVTLANTAGATLDLNNLNLGIGSLAGRRHNGW